MLWYKFKIRNFIVGLILFIASTTVLAHNYELKFDRYASPYEGATIFQSTYNFYEYVDDYFLPSSEGKKNLLWSTARLGHFYVDTVLSSFFMVAQHEIFGHGYRGRELGLQSLSYGIYIDHGWTAYTSASYNNLNIYEQNSVKAAGIEANTILAQQIRQPWFTEQKIDHRDAVFYILNQIEAMRYAYTTPSNNSSASNDITNYISGVNSYYNSTNTLSNNKLRKYVLVDLLDPALFYSIYGIGKYIYNGAATVPMYMFKFNGYEYLPNMHTVFAPYGIELQLQNYINTPNGELVQVNLRGGSNSNINTAGLDINITPIWRYKKLEFSNNLSFWYQPDMIYANATVAKRRLGFSEFVGVSYAAIQNLAWLLDLGYKTIGFTPGFQLGNAVIVRFGLRW